MSAKDADDWHTDDSDWLSSSDEESSKSRKNKASKRRPLPSGFGGKTVDDGNKVKKILEKKS